MKKLILLLSLFPLFTFSQFLSIDESNGLVNNQVSIIKKDLNNNLWIRTALGVTKYDGSTFTNYSVSNGLASASIKDIEVDNTGKVWIATYNGLSIYDGIFWDHHTFGTSITANFINDIEIAENGDVWIATNAGIKVFNGASYYNYTIAHGLPTNDIKLLSKDNNGTMWIGSNNGLTKFENLEFTVYTTVDGLSSNIINELLATDKVYTYCGNNFNVIDGNDITIAPSLYSSTYSSIKNITKDANDSIWLCFSDKIVKLNNLDIDYTLNNLNTTLPENYNSSYIYNDKMYVGTNLGMFYTNFSTIQHKDSINSHCDTLDINENDMLMFPTAITNNPAYASSSSIWIGGIDESSNLHTAYGKWPTFLDITGNNFSYGPLGANQNSIEFSQKWHYPRKILKSEIDNHIANWNTGGYQIPVSIFDWPEIAEYEDFNSNSIYDPENGDYPIIRGDMAILSFFNDAIRIENRDPMLIEVQALSYAFSSTDSALDNTVFVNYKIRNKSTNNYNAVHIGVFRDFDLGGPYDDYVGTDTILNSIYVYNSDNTDDIYGTGNIPAEALVMLNTKMSSSTYYSNNSGITGAPTESSEYYNYLLGYWKDGSPMTYGGEGHGGTDVVKNVFPGDPLSSSGWTELNAGNTPGDRRILSVVGPFDLAVGQELCLDLAFIQATAWGSTNLMSVKELQGRTHHIHSWYQNQSFSCDSIITYPEDTFQLYTEDISFCGNTAGYIYLNTNKIGGTYPFTYTWTDETNSFTSNLQDLYVSAPNVDTEYYITVIDADGFSVTDTLTYSIVQPLTFELANDTLICVGELITLDAGTHDSYIWSNGHNSSQIQVSEANTYFVTITDGVCTAEDEIEVNFSIPDINLSDITPTCVGVLFNLSINNFPSILWNTGDTDSSITVNTGVLGSSYYSVTVTDSMNCEHFDSTLVTINSIPTLFLGNDTTILDTQNVYLDANIGVGATYNWYNGNTNSTNTFYGYSGQGVYDILVEATDVNGCSTDDDIIITVDFYLKTDEQNQIDLSIYPNPSSNLITVDGNINNRQNYQLINNQGKLIKEGYINSSNKTISLNNIAKGVYFLRINELNITKKIIIN